MIAVDTNILVRLLAADDPAQSARAQKLFDQLGEADQSAWVSDTVLVELVWTLARAYGHSRGELSLAIRALADHGSVTLESDAAVKQALPLFEQGSADFSDCLLATKAALAGCERLVTFDKGMKKLPQVHLI